MWGWVAAPEPPSPVPPGTPTAPGRAVVGEKSVARVRGVSGLREGRSLVLLGWDSVPT